MDVAALIPLADAIPVPWGWLQLLLLLTFIAHLLFMNLMLGTAVIALTNELRQPAAPAPLARDLAGKLPLFIAFAVNFGVAPLLFLQVLYGQFLYTSSVLMAVYWLAVVGLLLLAYASAYLYRLQHDNLGSKRRLVLGLAVLLLLAIAFIFANNMTLMLRPAAWVSYFSQRHGTLLNLADPTLLPRWLHFMTASVAVAGLFVAVTGQRQRHLDPLAPNRVTAGLHWFSYATMVQIAVGLVFLITLPPPIRGLFLGDSTLHTTLLLTGMTAALAALALAMAGRVWPTLAAAGATVIIMVLMRDLVRQAFLAPYFSPAELTVVPQYSPLVVFGLALAVGLILIAYMLRLAARAGKEARR